MSETQLIRSIRDALQLAFPRCKVLRLNAGMGRRGVHLLPAGTPDICVMLPYSRCTWLEAKATTKLRKAQIEWEADAAALNHAVYVVRDVETAIAVVRDEIKRGERVHNACMLEAARAGRFV